jgi:hypothetical protein
MQSLCSEYGGSSSSDLADHSGRTVWGTDICVRLFCVCVVLCVGSGLAMGWFPVQGLVPTVCLYRIKKLKNRPKSKAL